MPTDEKIIQSPRVKSWWKKLPFVGVINSVLTLVITSIILDLPNANFNAPFSRGGDSDFYIMISSNIDRSGWATNNSHLGFPQGQHLNDFPQTLDNFHILTLKFLNTFFTSVESVNIFYILTFIFASATMYLAINRLTQNKYIAIVISQLFAFAPYHLIRGANHLFLSAYYAIPLVLIVFYFLSQNKNVSYKEIIFVAILSASTGAYYGVFTLITCGLCALVCLAKGGFKNNIYFKKSVIFALVCSFSYILNLLPTLLYILKNGANTSVASRTAGETELYGLQLTDLLFPRTGYRVDSISNFSGQLHDTPIQSELGQSLGLIASLTLMLIGFLAFRSIFGNKKFKDEYKFLSFSILSFILIAVTSGLALAISALGLRDIRAWNRVSIFIMGATLFILAMLLIDLKNKIDLMYKNNSVKIFTGILIFILIFGLFDQTSPQDRVSQKDNVAQYQSDCKYVNKIKDNLGDTGVVLQLPITDFPEPKKAINDKVYSQALLNSCDSNLYWSFGAMQGRDDISNAKLKNALDISVEEFKKEAIKLNFEGIDIDLNAQSLVNSNLTDDLINTSKYAAIYSPDNSRVFIKLGN